MKLGAFDYLVKPLDVNQLQEVVEHAFEISRLMRVPAILEEGDRRKIDPIYWSLARPSGGLQADWPHRPAKRQADSG